MNISYIIAVGIGGFFGAVSRYFTLLLFVERFHLSSSYGVLFVNVAGSFLAGIFTGLPAGLQGDYIKFFFITGFLGALTTFSAFSLDNLIMLRNGDYKNMMINIVLNIVLTIIFVSGGYLLSKKIAG